MEEKDKIEGGYILLARKIIESQIWQKPPEYLKIWIYILCRVNWKNSKKNERGEELFNFRQEKIPGVTLDQVYNFLKWARSLNYSDCTTQITTQKTTRGVRLKVNNYAYYQDIENYKLPHRNPHELPQNYHTIPKRSNKRDINKLISLSTEEREILKNYLLDLNKNRKNKIEDIDAYIRKLLENGDCLTKLEKAKKKLERQKAKGNIPPPEEKIENPADIQVLRDNLKFIKPKGEKKNG